VNARRNALRAAALAGALALAAPAARAQDFEPAGPAGSARSASAFLDAALPPAGAGTRLELLGVTRYALPELATRAVAAAAGWRTLRIAAGLSQTGDEALGWTAVGAAAGVAGPGWGAGLRAVGRRDRTLLDPAVRWGGEVGAGLRLEAGGPFTAWASAPSAWSAGAAPPLARGFSLGASVRGEGVRGWIEHEARPEGPGAQAVHRAGVALEAGVFGVWVEGIDAPLRAALGMEARAGAMRVVASLESHPLLGEVVRLSLGLGGGADGDLP